MKTQMNAHYVQADPALDWQRAFESWLSENLMRDRKERDPKTISAYLSDMRDFARYFHRANPGAFFTPDQFFSYDAKGYFLELLDTKSASTYRRRRTALDLFSQFARENGWLEANPMARIPNVDVTARSPRDIDEDQRIQLEKAFMAEEHTLIGLRDSVLFFLMSNAGLRISEAVGLPEANVNLDDGELRVIGKFKKERMVKIGGILLEKLRIWRDLKPDSVDGIFLCAPRTGKAIGRIQAWKRFKKLCKRAGVTNVTPHALRHTYVYRYMDAVMQGDYARLPAAIDAVCQQTGDTPAVILKFYTNARESDMRAAAEMM